MSYTGNVLRINLTSGQSKIEDLNRDWAEDYLGGKGLGIKYLYEELTPGIAPLSPENKIILMTGPLTGTIAPMSGKLTIVTKSPATGTILDCSIGGHFAGELKYAGYDTMIIEGKADKPVYLYVENGKAEVRDAGHLWGRGAHETEFILQDSINDGMKVLVIGQAGENQVTMSCITSELYRQAGRGGVGAVMGSKNLKAIVVRGNGSVDVPNIGEFTEIVKEIMYTDTLTDANLWVHSDGTPMIVDLAQSSGILPTKNFQQGTFNGFENINSDAVKAARAGKKGCLSCALGCGNYTRKGKAVVEGPEYETLAICGSNCGIDDLEAVVEFNNLCDDYGLDTISAGNVTAFAMELTEKGIKDFGLRFGDKESYLQVPGLIARKEGIGIDLGLGVKKLAEKYGGTEFAMHVKGLEFPGYEPRGAWGMGLAYATSDRGACHLRAWTVGEEAFGEREPFSVEGKAELVVGLQNYQAVKFSLVLCDFWALSLDTMATMYAALTNRQVSAAELEKIGERIVNLARQFNVREGFNKINDNLPSRIFNDALKTGATEGKVLPREMFEQMLTEFYNLRGWDQDGKPTSDKLLELGIKA